MAAESTRDRYVDLILGPAGLDELPFPGRVVIVAVEPTNTLALALVERVRELGGYPAAVRPTDLAEAKSTPAGLPPPSVVLLKDPRLTQEAVRVDPAKVLRPDGSWPHKQIVAPCPNEDWASRLWPGDPASEEKLWLAIERICRLDSADPDGAWHRRHAALAERARILDGLELDRIRLLDQAAGTDLSVGLLKSSRWCNGRAQTATGAAFVPNVPCEEVFTAPDPQRVEGIAVASRPFAIGRFLVELEPIEFRAGEDARLAIRRGEQELAELLSRTGGLRLGEVALVDSDSPLRQLGVLFGDTLLDENAACHIAFGGSIPGSYAPEEHGLANRSDCHVDIVIGGQATEVLGYTRAGEEVRLLCGGAWQGALAAAGPAPPASRIPEIVELIGAAWRYDTDLRFGQLIRNAMPGPPSDMAFETLSDEQVRAGLEMWAARDASDRAGGRDPARIRGLLAALETRWLANPDLRLCQLLRWVARARGFPYDSGVARLEDDQWLAALSPTEPNGSGSES